MSRPNILLITSDQQLFDTLGFKNPHIKTPSLDRLAREGTDFSRAYTINPVCTPTRATLITGMYPSLHGAWTIGVKLAEDIPTLGDSFREAGYDATLIGKAHFQPLADGDKPHEKSIECQPILRDLDFWRTFNETHTPWYGFDHVETCRQHGDASQAGGHYGVWCEENGFTEWKNYYRTWPHDEKSCRRGAWNIPEAYHYTTWTGQRTIASIRRSVKNDKPFFLWSSFHDPHPPYVVPEPWASMYDPADMPIGKLTPGELEKMPPPHQMTQDPQADWSSFSEEGGSMCHGYFYHAISEEQLRKDMAIYYGMVSFMDHQIGLILDELDAQGIADNTLIVFTTDHGHYIGHHGLTAKGPFHYEQGIKLPFIVRYPGHVPAGESSSSLQALVDLPQTFLSACAIEVPGIMQGVDQMPVWRGEKDSVRDGVICEFRHNPTKVHLRSYINERYKLTLYRDRKWGELFDLQEDPEEINNVFEDSDYASIKATLMSQWLNEEMRREHTRMPRVACA